MKPKLLDRSLVAGCCTGHKSLLLHVRGWDMDQTKSSKYSSNIFFPKMVSDILGSSYHADVFSSVNFSDKFGFN